MSTVATLDLSVIAHTADFESGMQRVSNSVHLGRGQINTLSHVAGVAGGPVRDLVHSFTLFPGPIGLAIGAFIAIKEIWSTASEHAKELDNENKKMRETFAKTQEQIGEVETFGKYEKGAHEAIKTTQKNIEELNTKVEESTGMWSSYFEIMRVGLFGGQTMTQQQAAMVNQLMDHQREINKVKIEYKQLDDVMARVKGVEFRTELAGTNKEAIGLSEKLMVVQNSIEVLQDRMQNKGQSTEIYAKMTDDMQKLQLEAKKTKEELDKALAAPGKLLAEGIKKELESIKGLLPNTDNLNRIQEQYKSLQDLQNKSVISPYEAGAGRKKLHEEQFKDLFNDSQKQIAANMTPLEVLQKKLAEIREENKEGFLSPEEMKKAIKRTQDAFDAAQEKAEKAQDKPERGRGTLAVSHAVNIGSAYVEGLKNRSTGDPAQQTNKLLATSNVLLAQIAQKTGTSYAIAGN